jgi:release factor glutamine methyltransferase
LVIETLLNKASAELADVAENPRLEARTLLAFALNKPVTWIIAWPDASIDATAQEQFSTLLTRRRQGEPLAYVTGQKEFWSLPLNVSTATLIPRADTECLVETALQLIQSHPITEVLDLGTGSGAIALALATEVPDLHITATDMSEAALAVARKNASRLNISTVSFLQSDWYSALDGAGVDLIISNPPYIAKGDAHLDEIGLQYEPQQALISGTDGLDDLRAIIGNAPASLRPGGFVAVEHGFDQADAVCELFQRSAFAHPQTVRDYSGNARVSFAQYPA